MRLIRALSLMEMRLRCVMAGSALVDACRSHSKDMNVVFCIKIIEALI